MTQPSSTPVPDISYWQDMFATLKERIRKPSRHPTFVMYFVGIIIIIGGFGLIEPMVSYWIFGRITNDAFPYAMISATYTYFVAIAATAAVDLILSYRHRKFLLMFFLLCSLCVFLCALFAAIYGAIPGKLTKAVYPSIVGYVLALFLWWVGNADNANLLDTPVAPTAPIGADATVKPNGDLSGFTT